MSPSPPIAGLSFPELCAQIAALGRTAYARGWLPATSGNLSARLDAERLAITASGRDKGALSVSDILCVDLHGQVLFDDGSRYGQTHSPSVHGPLLSPSGHGQALLPTAHGYSLSPSTMRPSAETLLHCQIYRCLPQMGAVLHTHSRAATVLSRACLARGELVLTGYELAKALTGVTSHEASVRLPVLENHQDMSVLAARAEPLFSGAGLLHGYLIAGHGLYTWGKSLPEAFRQLEALEFLLECALWEGRTS